MTPKQRAIGLLIRGFEGVTDELSLRVMRARLAAVAALPELAQFSCIAKELQRATEREIGV